MPSDFELAIGKGIEVELTTGRKVTIRVVELTRFLENGEIPDTLTPLVHQELFGDDGATPKEREQRYLGSLKVAKWVTENVLVTKVTGLFNVEYFEIYGLAVNPAKALARFRIQQARHVGVSDDLLEMEPVSEPAA
jgi:hypothetical protein